VKGNPQGKQVEVPMGALTVGRAEDSDLIIASTRVSRHHCEILNEQNRVLVRDKGSGNGTLVNGAKVEEQVLGPGDELQIGPLTFCVEIDGRRDRVGTPAAGPARPAAAAQPKPAPRPAAPAKAPPPAARPKAAPQPQAKGPAKAAPKFPAKRGGAEDILASLERLAAGKRPAQPPPPQKKKDDNVLEISDEDLLDTDK
jgi:predicted component of type VI protein secretion system